MNETSLLLGQQCRSNFGLCFLLYFRYEREQSCLVLQKHQDDDPVYPDVPLTKGQSLLLLMSYVLRHNLTGVALQDLLTLFNEHFPGLVPATSYLFHKAYGQFGQYVPHFYRINCETYMGPSETAPKNCSSCNSEFDIERT